MDCPKCGAAAGGGPECPACGIIMSRWNPDARPVMPPRQPQVVEAKGGGGGAVLAVIILVGLIIAGVFAFRKSEAPPAGDLDDQLNQINQRATQSKRNLENAQSPELDKLINKGAENQKKAAEYEKSIEKRRGTSTPASESEQTAKEESRFLRKYGRLLLKVGILAAIGAVALYRMTLG